MESHWCCPERHIHRREKMGCELYEHLLWLTSIQHRSAGDNSGLISGRSQSDYLCHVLPNKHNVNMTSSPYRSFTLSFTLAASSDWYRFAVVCLVGSLYLKYPIFQGIHHWRYISCICFVLECVVIFCVTHTVHFSYSGSHFYFRIILLLFYEISSQISIDFSGRRLLSTRSY